VNNAKATMECLGIAKITEETANAEEMAMAVAAAE
jgi:hypothetical protein